MKDDRVRRMTAAAMFAAMCAVATMALRIPTPTNGYVHLGDSFVLLAGFVLGPAYGAAAAGIGSMLADLLSGYAYYMPGTLIIKAACAACAALIYSKLHGTVTACAVGAVAAECIMVLGYLAFEALALGYGAGALAGVAMNIGQGVFGAVSASIMLNVAERCAPSLRGADAHGRR